MDLGFLCVQLLSERIVLLQQKSVLESELFQLCIEVEIQELCLTC